MAYAQSSSTLGTGAVGRRVRAARRSAPAAVRLVAAPKRTSSTLGTGGAAQAAGSSSTTLGTAARGWRRHRQRNLKHARHRGTAPRRYEQHDARTAAVRPARHRHRNLEHARDWRSTAGKDSTSHDAGYRRQRCRQRQVRNLEHDGPPAAPRRAASKLGIELDDGYGRSAAARRRASRSGAAHLQHGKHRGESRELEPPGLR